MAECKGLVKLFGKTIQVPPDENWCRDQAKENSNHSLLSAATPRDDEAPRSEDTNDQATASSTASNDQRPSSPAPLAEQEPIMAVKPFSFQANDSANTDSLQNPPKKPDKILPCPRCNSQDTKFCYYNNYNLNQPRHFCKNCQRYWTDGGTMRNVPIGAGRRRGKNSASVQLKHMTIPGNAPQIVVQRQQCTNGTMLSFTSEMVNDSVGPMASVPNVTENMTRFGKKEEQRNSHSNSCGAAVIGTVQTHKDASVQVPLNFSSSWSSNWNPAFPMYSPNYYPPVFYPVGQCWSFAPCISPGLPPLTSVTSNAESWQAEPCSPLGKHSRDELHPVDKNVDSASANAEYNSQEKSIWVPKTLRISDPEEAAMSSIWLSIGIKKGKGEDAASGGMFKGFEAKTKFDAKNSALETSQHINPNPAALSRSHDFHERLS